MVTVDVLNAEEMPGSAVEREALDDFRALSIAVAEGAPRHAASKTKRPMTIESFMAIIGMLDGLEHRFESVRYASAVCDVDRSYLNPTAARCPDGTATRCSDD